MLFLLLAHKAGARGSPGCRTLGGHLPLTLTTLTTSYDRPHPATLLILCLPRPNCPPCLLAVNSVGGPSASAHVVRRQDLSTLTTPVDSEEVGPDVPAPARPSRRQPTRRRKQREMASPTCQPPLADPSSLHSTRFILAMSTSLYNLVSSSLASVPCAQPASRPAPLTAPPRPACRHLASGSTLHLCFCNSRARPSARARSTLARSRARSS